MSCFCNIVCKLYLTVSDAHHQVILPVTAHAQVENTLIPKNLSVKNQAILKISIQREPNNLDMHQAIQK